MPLALRHLRRDFEGVVAVEDVRLTAGAGTCTVLAGRNGSGKTTTLQMAAGRLAPTAGSVEVDGQDVSTVAGGRHARHAVTFAFDTPVFYPDLTVEEHLGLVATSHDLGDAADEDIERLLDDFDLQQRRTFLPDQLSSGMRQKLGLSCMLLRPGHVVLLDEPTRALDPRTRAVLWSALAARKAGGAAIVFSSHQLDFPQELADQMVVLHDGLVQDQGAYRAVVDGAAVAELGLT